MSRQTHRGLWSTVWQFGLYVSALGVASLALAQSNVAPVAIAANASEGGRTAELLANSDFEANSLPVGWRVAGTNVFSPLGARVGKSFANDLPGWHPISEAGAEGEIARESESPLNEANPHSLRLTLRKPGGRFGVANDGVRGMEVRNNEWYDVTFHVRAQPRENPRWGYSLTVSLESEDGRNVCARTTLPGINGDGWRRYTVALHARKSDPRAHLVITLDEPGAVWLDTVSLLLRKNGMPAGSLNPAARTP